MSSQSSHIPTTQGCDLQSSIENASMLDAESTSNKLDHSPTMALANMSISEVHSTLMFMGGLPFPQAPSGSSPAGVKRSRDQDVDQDNDSTVKRNKHEIHTESPAIKYEGFHGTYKADPNLNTPTSSQRLKNGTTPKPTTSGVGLMDMPAEVRLRILSYALTSIAGPAGTISINPRAKTLSKPTGEFQGHDCSGKGQTKWQARRGLLQTCHALREEALDVLYNKNTFFARMAQCDEYEFSFEKLRFERWLKSFGGDAEVQRVRKVTFGVEWSPLEEDEGLQRRKGDVHVGICRGNVTVEGSQRIAECPAAPLEQIKELVEEFMVGKAMGEGLGCEEWIAVWDKVQELMRSGWGTPY